MVNGKDEKTAIVIQGLTSKFRKPMSLICGAERHHYSMFNVGRSMFDVHFFRYTSTVLQPKTNSALIGLPLLLIIMIFDRDPVRGE